MSRYHLSNCRLTSVSVIAVMSLSLLGCPAPRQVLPDATRGQLEPGSTAPELSVPPALATLFPQNLTPQMSGERADLAQAAFRDENAAAWLTLAQSAIAGWSMAGSAYMAAHSGAAPSTLHELASFVFTWPTAGPGSRDYAVFDRLETASTRAEQVVADAAVGQYRVGMELTDGGRLLQVLGCRVGPETAKYAIKDMMLHPRGVMGDASVGRDAYLQPKFAMDLARTATISDPRVAWSATGISTAMLRGIPADARIAAAASQLSAMFTTAAKTAGRLPADLNELETYSCRRLLNLVPCAPEEAHIRIEFDGAQGYRWRLRYPSGAQNDSIVWCHSLSSAQAELRRRAFAAYQQEYPAAESQFRPFGAWRVVPSEAATLPGADLLHRTITGE